MQKWEEDILLKEQGKAEGLAEGKAEGIATGKAEATDEAVRKTIASLKKYNVSREDIIEEISTSYPDYADKVADLL